MADTVRYLMEEMVPELEDLEKRGYFTKAELRSMVKKRTDFEYRLKRRAAKVSDFVRYAEYEIALESLRKVRVKLMGGAGGSKRTLADYCILRRVNFVFERATRKFRGDLSLWVRWLDFCTASKSSKHISRILAQALKLHPAVPGLWARAAAWEFDHKRDSSAARKLLQRGLRMCPSSQQLWIEFFRFELLYAAQLRARRSVLGLGEDEVEEQDIEAEGAEAALEGGNDEGSKGKEKAVGALLKGAVAAVVMRKALAAFPAELQLRGRLLGVLDQFDFEGCGEMANHLLESIEKDFGQTAEAWDLLARRAGSTSTCGAVEAASGVYERAVKTSPTAEVFSVYICFLEQQLEEACQKAGTLEDGDRGGHEAAAQQLADALLKLHARAVEAGAATESSLVRWSELARRCGLLEEVNKAMEAAAGRQGPCSASLWGARLSLAKSADILEQQPGREPKSRHCLKSHETKGLRDLSLAALADTAADDKAIDIWLHVLELVASTGDAKTLAAILQELELRVAGSAKGPLRGGMGSVAAAAVEVTYSLAGLQAARKLYERLLPLPPPGGSFFHVIIGIELAVAASAYSGRGEGEGAAAQAARIRRLFDAAADAYGETDSELWLRYMRWDGSGTAQGSIYWRAMKALADPSQFLAAHRESVRG